MNLNSLRSFTIALFFAIAPIQMLFAQSGTAAVNETQNDAQGTVTVAGLPPKKPGILRVAVTLPKTQLAQQNPGGGGGEALRTLEMQYLRGPNIEVVPITAMIPFQINAEVKEKDCDFLLYSTLTEKQASSGSFFSKALPLASMLPMAGALGSAGGAIATAATSAVVTSAAGLSTTVKAKSEMTLTYKLVAMHKGAETPLLENSLKAKAKQDGEDIVSPLVEQEATAIVAQLSTKK